MARARCSSHFRRYLDQYGQTMAATCFLCCTGVSGADSVCVDKSFPDMQVSVYLRPSIGCPSLTFVRRLYSV